MRSDGSSRGSHRRPLSSSPSTTCSTFDLHKRTGLYVTFYSLGDRRERGLALLRMKKLYRAAGFEIEGHELPDYLPLMLEFAAAAHRRAR